MKKVWTTLLGLILVSLSVVTSAFAIFQYQKAETIVDIDVTPNRAQFKEVSNDYYTVVFFASPYYATGAEVTRNGETVTLTDPLEIANSSDNPYNSDEDYIIIGPRLGATESQYANAHFPDGNAHYISARNIDEDKLNTYGAITPYKKKEFTGEILINEDLNINERTSTFVAKTVRGNISSDVLSGMKVTTQFKDKYGFGPEFVGWTYDINAAKTRTMYGEDRYAKNGNYKLGDTRGWGNEYADQIGNYGVQGEIAQMTSLTSLEHIDQLQSTAGDGKGIDGSLAGDHVIYLYPVFVAKNYDTNKSIGGKTTAFIKFRYRPDTTFSTEHNQYLYEYNQTAEIDYSKKRFTLGFFQKEATSFTSDPNYFLSDVFLDFTDERNIQIDISPANAINSWAGAWSTLLDHQTLENLTDIKTGKTLENGYYNVDISFFQYKGKGTEEGYITEEQGAEDVQRVYDEYVASNKYCAVYASRQDNHPDTLGLDWLPITRTGFEVPSTYVIGLQRVEQYHVTSNRFSGSIDDYVAAGYKTLFTTPFGETVNTTFFATTNVNLDKGDEFSILIEDTTTQTIPYTLEAMSSKEAEAFNNEYLDSLLLEVEDKDTIPTEYNPLIPIGDVGTTDEKISLVSDKTKEKNKMVANEAGNYSLIFTIEYEKGHPSKINVAYRQNLHTYEFVILSSAPSSSEIFRDYDALRSQDNFLAGAQVTIFDSVTMDLTMNMKYTDETEVLSMTLQELLDANPTKVLRDTMTGWKIDPNIFTTKKFTMTRDYILYLADK